MTNALVPVPDSLQTVSGELVRLIEDARKLSTRGKAKATQRAYKSDWKQFVQFCQDHGVQPLPASPAVVAGFVVFLAQTGRRPATIERRLTSISQNHKAKGYVSPTANPQVREVLKAVKRKLGAKQNQKKPLTIEHLEKMIAALPLNLPGKRDRAILLVGFAGGFRRSELVSIQIAEIEFVKQGMVIFLAKCKTDQEGKGRSIGIPYAKDQTMCPVRALRSWIRAANIRSGPIFRSIDRHGNVNKGLSDGSVATIIKRATAAAGIDPTGFSGHSLRAGLATSAARAGKSERAIMATTGHRSREMVRRYIRDGSLFNDNAAEGLL